MVMSQEKLQTMSMQNFRGVREVHYGIVQEVNARKNNFHMKGCVPRHTLKQGKITYWKWAIYVIARAENRA